MDIINSFPGYEYTTTTDLTGKSHVVNMYRGVDLGKGGYNYAVHGVYKDVVLLDVASMHPTSLILMNVYGKYTPKFKALLDARLAIKHKDYDAARQMMDGKLAKYLGDPKSAKALSNSLKVVINSQYGLTSASESFWPQHDKRNVNNIVALRGALFMKTLLDAVTEKGYTVVHIKTDSIKIANADQHIIDFCMEFAQKYGYTFEHEATFEKFCLVTDADYVAKYKWSANKEDIGKWTATGAFFSHPYVFKTLFSKEPILFEDLCEKRTLKKGSAMYLDFNENLPEGEHSYSFVGKAGNFCPIKPGCKGGILYAERNGKYNSITGTKGYRWREAIIVKEAGKEDTIDLDYFNQKVDKCFEKIEKYTDARLFCSDAPLDFESYSQDEPPILDCGKSTCEGCPNLKQTKYTSNCAVGLDNSEYILQQAEQEVEEELAKNVIRLD